jgi:hypothetical protein
MHSLTGTSYANSSAGFASPIHNPEICAAAHTFFNQSNREQIFSEQAQSYSNDPKQTIGSLLLLWRALTGSIYEALIKPR